MSDTTKAAAEINATALRVLRERLEQAKGTAQREHFGTAVQALTKAGYSEK